MKKLNKYILLNGGTATRHAFASGIKEAPVEYYHTKNILLHIQQNGAPVFLYNGISIDWNNSSVFTRLRATDQQFCGILYDYFAYHTIPANDPINRSYVNSAEKISQMLSLALHSITVPETYIFREESFLQNQEYLAEHLVFPQIYKTDGSKGKNVHYVSSMEELQEHVTRKKPHILALTQPFIENEFDTRTLVAFGKILGTIKRTRTGGYLNNIAQGAIPSPYELTPEEERIALLSAKVCGIDFAGVDMIHTKNGPVVLEVNKSPQVGGFESVFKINVFSHIAEMLQQKSSTIENPPL